MGDHDPATKATRRRFERVAMGALLRPGGVHSSNIVERHQAIVAVAACAGLAIVLGDQGGRELHRSELSMGDEPDHITLNRPGIPGGS